MNKKVVVVVLLCSVSLRASMFRRQVVTQPINLQFNSVVQAPKFEKIDAAPKIMSKDSHQVLAKQVVDQAMSQPSQASGQNVQKSQSVAASLVVPDAVRLQSVWSLLFSGQKDQVGQQGKVAVAEKEQSLSDQSLVTPVEGKQVSKDAVVVNQADQVASSAINKESGAVIEQSTKSFVQSTESSVRPKLNFLSGISDKSQLKSRSENAALVQEGKLEFKNLQEYTQAQLKAENAAEVEALKPINRQVAVELNKQWPAVFEQYRQERQALGQEVVEKRVKLLKEQVENKIYTELVAKNQLNIEGAKARAVKEFQAKAVRPTSGKIKLTTPKPLQSVQTESLVRAQAENKMKASLIESMVDAQFTPQFESAWVQDYALDYQLEKQAQASHEVVNAAKDKYKAELGLKMYEKLTAEDKALIKQAGQDAVISWKLQNQQDATARLTPENQVSIKQAGQQAVPNGRISNYVIAAAA